MYIFYTCTYNFLLDNVSSSQEHPEIEVDNRNSNIGNEGNTDLQSNSNAPGRKTPKKNKLKSFKQQKLKELDFEKARQHGLANSVRKIDQVKKQDSGKEGF